MTCLSPAETAVIDKWVRDGGLLIGTGLTSTLDADGAKLPNFSLANLFGCDYVTIEDRYLANRWGSYLQRNVRSGMEGLARHHPGGRGAVRRSESTAGYRGSGDAHLPGGSLARGQGQ